MSFEVGDRVQLTDVLGADHFGLSDDLFATMIKTGTVTEIVPSIEADIEGNMFKVEMDEPVPYPSDQRQLIEALGLPEYEVFGPEEITLINGQG